MQITISTGKQKGYRERTFVFKTNQDIPLGYFKTRKSLDQYSFPKYIDGTVEEYNEGGGGVYEWKNFDDEATGWFDDLKVQNIFSIHINGVNINQEIIDEAAKVGATTKFPILYHVQFMFDSIPEWIFNWYPTTGTLSKQKTTDKYYSMKSLGNYLTIKEALEACK